MKDFSSPSYKQMAYDFLVDQIASHTYRVGDKLNERQIAQQLGISRTPVREALHMLVAEGWVTVLPRVGTVVNGMTLQRVEDMFQVRLSLETLAVGLFAGIATAADLAALRELVLAQKRYAHINPTEFIRCDREFHIYIAVHSGNALLQEILAKINSPLVRTGLQSVCDSARYGWSLREHIAVIDALARGHRRTAMQAMHRHIERTRLNLHKQLSRNHMETDSE